MEKRRRIDLLSVVLLVVAAILAFFIVTGTILAFASGNVRISSEKRTLFTDGVHNPAKETLIAADSSGTTAIFADIGILRAVTADPESVTVVVSPFLPYSSVDTAFQEELVQKTQAVRMSLLAWFRVHTINEITAMGEKGVKQELLHEINANLILGQIRQIYFEEYMVLR
jgi:flagellar FliL protein